MEENVIQDDKLRAVQFVEQLQEMYFVRRDLEGLFPMMDESTSWIGTGSQELGHSIEDAGEAFMRELAEYPGSFHVLSSAYEVQQLSDEIFVVYGRHVARPAHADLADLQNRLSAVCQKTAEGFRIMHLHMSHPDVDQESGEYFTKRETALNRQELKRRVEEATMQLQLRNQELEALTDNIPGGVVQCADDNVFTLLSMSRSFLSLFGYARADIEALFHNKFIEMIHTDDRARVLALRDQQRNEGSALELEYRVTHKDGTILWVLDKGKIQRLPDGSSTIFSVMLDITNQKAASDALRLSLERHQIILDQGSDIIFEWNILQDTLSFSSNWEKKFGYQPVKDEISTRIPFSDNVHPEDRQSFAQIMREIAEGRAYAESEFRIRNFWGQYTWNRIRASTQFDQENRAIKAVGVILDVDSEKLEQAALLEQARRDSLTGLYNKNTVQLLADEQIRKQGGQVGYQALMIVDVDDFKMVNDSYGHLCGDAVLLELAGALRSSFRSSDVIGRIGGDEFLVYLPNIDGEAGARARAARALGAMANIRPTTHAAPVSCSIGVALFPLGEMSYLELYHCADLALYDRKHRGKGGLSFYNAEMDENSLPSGLARSAISPVIDSEASALNEKLAQYAFRMMYNMVATETAIKQLLDIVGRTYDVSRAYIFESSEDGLFCSNTFEWCADGVSSEIDSLQNLSYAEDLGGYLSNFDENGIFYCRDIHELKKPLYDVLAPQGICALLQCAIRDDGVFGGYVGFDECRSNRHWTKEQIDSLTLTSNVLSTFLTKLRLKEKLDKLTEKQQEL